jgi:hypothetical protein
MMAQVSGGSQPGGQRLSSSSVGSAIVFVLAAAVLIAGVTYAVLGKHSHPSDHAAAKRLISAAAPTQAATLAAASTAVPPTSRTSHHAARRSHSARNRQHAPKAQHVAAVATAPRTTSTKAPAKDAALVPKRTFLAVMHHKTKGYRSAKAKHPEMVVPKAWYGRGSVLPILAIRHGRVKVRLARRPNGATTWLNGNAVQLSITYYALVIDLSKRHIYVFKHGKQKHGFPIGEGTSRTPTPTGKYFIAFHAPPNGPEYGSVMLETSAHSEVFTTFGGGNDAIIAIHGPIYSDSRIGNHGARISNGCIRMHERQLVKVAKVLDGSPLFIVH